MECLVHFAEDWTDIIHDEGYTDCVQGGLCGSVVLSIAGPRTQGELAVAYVKSRCFDLPRFGRFCPPFEVLTSSPTASMPTVVPTTFIPSEYPSLAGWIATISATTVSTQEVDDTQIEDFTLNIAEFYGVNPADVTPVVTYETSGSMTISIPEIVAEAE
eukprot:UN26052